ncbi:N-acetylmuramoyl-L-alanine amidase [Bacillus sp. ISL-35]|uniref:N-acetylmuramoyl-L-alanine amidase n=1 Tax=Bacillus sp. ISL-35 TaxID=2819122 RepID=UPI001BE8E2D5|nr:N-acetylmuramoyl-L-alanine amidase [Bacillus sp. ISL-35]MBT2678918.1 N-acetylmuramoyl-L-alanine amidase [Bacillus sp. ISL-35]MBT2703914.1 N-acetylmuramoyl-L-alanine amidase [Chryseobacterium sp. ISL-80]
MKIMLDAGHGYNTPGKRSPDGLREYEFNRAVANYAKQLLENYKNVTVYFSHSDQRDVSLTARTDKANSLNVDIFVSIHANAFGSGGWNNVGGIETYVYPSRPPVANQLAQKIQRNLVIATGLENRGVRTADFHVLRETKMDAVLVEGGFMTNRNEVELLRSETYRRTVAEGIVTALAEQFKLQRKDNAKPVPAASSAPAKSAAAARKGGLYKVQAGAFEDERNAEELAARLRKAGFEAFIEQE